MTDLAISVSGLGKAYRIYNQRFDRLREALSPSRTKFHEEAWVLKDLNLELPRGTTCGLIGKNGAGKSTALKIIAGKLRPTVGTVEVNGRVSSILELGTGFQPSLTGRENAKLNALFFGQRPWEVDARIEEILEFAELTEIADHLLSTYSSGERARLAFAVITTMSPEILILDEALATGDVGYAEKGKYFLRRLTERGTTTLVASHDVNFLVATCDHMIWLDKGVVRNSGSPVVVAKDYLSNMSMASLDLDRPDTVLLRFEVKDGAPDLTYLVHCLEWISPSGDVVGSHFVGEDDAFEHCLSLSGKIGINAGLARCGWGKAQVQEEDGSTFRAVTPQDGPGGAAYVALPVPSAPLAAPTQLRVGGCNDLKGEMELSIFLNGEYLPIGSCGRDTGQLPWYRNEFEIGEILTSNPALSAD
jgi:ABC-type polysaccharide/polyol phosphate transport system ATPase subunit